MKNVSSRFLLKYSFCVLYFAMAFAFWSIGRGESEENPERGVERFVRAYQPIYVGYTFDEGDQAFMDFSLSIMMPIGIMNYFDKSLPENAFPDAGKYVPRCNKIPRVYLGFNGRAGQYIGNRESSPVVGKRFNPLVSFRWWDDAAPEFKLDNYFEVSYGHESNGQRLGGFNDSGNSEDYIDWGARYAALRDEYRIADGSPSNARDEISRGWDYIGARWSRSWKKGDDTFVLLLDGKYFLSSGILQDRREDYYDWENDGNWLQDFDGEIVRSKVDGLTANLHYITEFKRFKNLDLSLELKTGYTNPFERITVKLEAGISYFAVWYRNGYNSDFVNYYHRDHSAGIALKIRQF